MNGIEVDPAAVKAAAGAWGDLEDFAASSEEGGMRHPYPMGGDDLGPYARPDLIDLDHALSGAKANWETRTESLTSKLGTFAWNLGDYAASVDDADHNNARALELGAVELPWHDRLPDHSDLNPNSEGE